MSLLCSRALSGVPCPTLRAAALAIGAAGLLVAAIGCGSNRGAGGLGEVGTYDADAGEAFIVGDASAPAALEASIEDNQITVKLITLSCSGDCAEVEGVATGGHPPYAFLWDDGSKSASRRVCPTSSSNYRLEVTDTAATGEFARPAETAQASLTADVLACPDAGEAGAPDGAVAGCLDPSADAGVPASAFQICGPSPVLAGDPTEPSLTTAPACATFVSGGTTPYAEFAAYDDAPSAQQSLGVALCQPLRAGQSYAVRVDLAGGSTASSGGPDSTELDLWGGKSLCPDDELLQTQVDSEPGSWVFCFVVTPKNDDDYIRLVPRFVGGTPGSYNLGCAQVSEVVPYPGMSSCPDDSPTDGLQLTGR